MTIEVEAPPTIEVEVNPVAAVLERAALYIEEFGWLQGDFGNKERGFCAVGAISEDQDPTTTIFFTPTYRAYEFFVSFIGGGAVSRWNDVPGRTAAEVTAALREAARQVRAT